MNNSNRGAGRSGTDSLEEFQGLYGAYHVAEQLIQKIWMHREFDIAHAFTLSGKSVRVISVGEWNRFAGPDFLGSELEIDGHRVVGDVEIHFRESDWEAHRHHLDPAYSNVVLHVVLHPPPAGRKLIWTRRGSTIETLTLIDLLWHDLEEYALNDAAASASGLPTDEALEHLLTLPPGERRELLFQCALDRWRHKVRFAGFRISRIGFEGACHRTCLEVLGYSRNRAAMLAVAERYPIESWSALDPSEILARKEIQWQRQGIRPANQPESRLGQYARVAGDGMGWIRRLERWSGHLDFTSEEEGPIRVGDTKVRLDMSALRRELVIGVLAGAVTGPRADTLAVDAFLPLLASNRGGSLFETWFAWVPGDGPSEHRKTLKRAGVGGLGRKAPHAHGWFQGLLGLMIRNGAP